MRSLFFIQEGPLFKDSNLPFKAQLVHQSHMMFHFNRGDIQLEWTIIISFLFLMLPIKWSITLIMEQALASIKTTTV